MLRRLAIILAAVALALLPAPAIAPAQAIATQAVYTLVSTPRTDGQVIVLDVPADLWPDLSRQAPIIERPGVERWMRR